MPLARRSIRSSCFQLIIAMLPISLKGALTQSHQGIPRHKWSPDFLDRGSVAPTGESACPTVVVGRKKCGRNSAAVDVSTVTAPSGLA